MTGLFRNFPTRALLCFLCGAGASADAAAEPVPIARSVSDYGALGDGRTDDTEAIQKCIDAGYDGVWHNCSRFLFPAGTYRVTHQIVVWAGVQLECDPKEPATILLPANTPGYGDPERMKPVFMSRLSAARPDRDNPAPFPEDIIAYYKGGKRPLPGWPWRWPEDYDSAKHDQHTVCPGCMPGNNFWSQIRNLRFRVEPGNPGACVIHYNNAQGSALFNLTFDLADDTFCAIAGGPGTTGCVIKGGRYGLYDVSELGKIMNSRFTGQKEAAYFAPNGSSRLWVGCTFEDSPVALKHTAPWRLTMVDCEIRNCALGVEMPIPNALLFIQNLKASRTPLLYRSDDRTIPGNPKGETVLPAYASGPAYVDGLKVAGGVIDRRVTLPKWNSVPAFTDVSKAANVKACGAIGDGKADDTAALRKAIESAETVYLPDGAYRVTDTLMLKPKTRLIGVHASAAKIFIENNTPGFMDAAHPRPIIDTPDAADADVHISQLAIAGLNAYSGSGGNTGAIAIRWRAGRKSSMSWINFNAHTSLLVTGNGGGTIFDSWTARHGLYRGVVIDHNREPLMVYGLSTEHQTDKALSLTGAKNVTFYCGGFGEGDYPTDSVMNEIVDSDNIAMVFAVIHPCGTDEHTREMTGFRIVNTPNILIAPFYRIHEEPMRHTVIDTRPDGTTNDLANSSFAMYTYGDISCPDAGGEGDGSPFRWLNPRNWLGGRK